MPDQDFCGKAPCPLENDRVGTRAFCNRRLPARAWTPDQVRGTGVVLRAVAKDGVVCLTKVLVGKCFAL